MRLSVLGLNHRTAPVQVRETFAIPIDVIPDFLRGLERRPEVSEALVLSTCNRVEVYVVPEPRAGGVAELLVDALAHSRRIPAHDVEAHSYYYEGTEAVRHLLRVCASLDSMVVGEPQILGQVKELAAVARGAGTIGPIFDRLLQRAFSTAKMVRTQTGIAKQRVSIGSVAVDLARRIFPRIDKCRVLLVGAGKMGQVTARSLASAGVERVYITNRSYGKALELAQQHGWRARAFSEFDDLLVEADVVLTSTGAAQPIIDARMLKPVIKQRKYRPLFIVDIAVPRNVDPDAGDFDTVYLYNVDDLEQISLENMESRSREAAAAEQMVGEVLSEVDQWFKTLEVTPTIRAIRERAQGLAQQELERSLSKRLKHLGPAERKALDKMMGALVNKLLHPTMSALKEAAKGDHGPTLVHAARILHGLGEADELALPAPLEADDEAPSDGSPIDIDPQAVKAQGNE